MNQKEKAAKPLLEQIFDETLAKLKDQEGFDETIIANLKTAYERGELKKVEKIISTIKPKEGE